MTKLNSLMGLKIKVGPVKKVKVTNNNDKFKRIGGIRKALVIKTKDGVYKARIIDNEGEKLNNNLLSFTPDSFEVKNRLSVFLKEKDETGRFVRLCRDVTKASCFPGTSERYIPFVENWIIEGYLVHKGLEQAFDFKDLICINNYKVNNVIVE